MYGCTVCLKVLIPTVTLGGRPLLSLPSSITFCKQLLINMYFVFLFRLFDQNYDGYIDKKEFKWMTTSAKISNKTIDIVFSVSFVT